jgi:hypothetical protein
MFAALRAAIAREAVRDEAFGVILARPHRQRTIAVRVSGARAHNFAAPHFATQQLGGAREVWKIGDHDVSSALTRSPRRRNREPVYIFAQGP